MAERDADKVPDVVPVCVELGVPVGEPVCEELGEPVCVPV